jgi:hypothetical protein
VLHQVDDIAKGLPIVGGLGILSDSGDGNSGSPSDPSTVQKRDASPPPTPSTPSAIPPDQLDSVRQAVAGLLMQQQQYDQAIGTLTAASGGLPVDPVALLHRLQALQSSQTPVNQPVSSPNAFNLAGIAGISGALGGLPVAGSLLSNTLGGNSGLLSAVGGITNGLPVVNGVLGNGGIANGVIGGVGSTVGGVLGGVTQAADSLLDGILGGLVGGIGQQNFNNNAPGVPVGTPQGPGATSTPRWPDATGLYPHSPSNAAPAVPPNTPMQNPAAFAFSSLAVDGTPDGSPLPAVPPPSPANSASSVPMGHDSPDPSSVSASPSAPPEESAPAPTGTTSKLARRRVDGGPIGQEAASDLLEDFNPSVPDASYVPPLMSSGKRSVSMGPEPTDSMEPAGSDPAEGEADDTSGSQKVLKARLTDSFPKRMLRRHLRGVSVSF